MVDFQAQRRLFARLHVQTQQVRTRADERHRRHHDLFTDRVDRRVRHLREQLLEVVVKRLILVRQHRQWAVVTHRARGFFSVAGHWLEDELEVFLRVTKRLLRMQQRFT